MFVEFVRVQGHCVFLSFILAMISPPLARAGALLMPEGKAGDLTTTFADANDAYDPQGRLVKTPSTASSKRRAMSIWRRRLADCGGEAGAMDFHGSVARRRWRRRRRLNTKVLGLAKLARA